MSNQPGFQAPPPVAVNWDPVIGIVVCVLSALGALALTCAGLFLGAIFGTMMTAIAHQPGSPDAAVSGPGPEAMVLFIAVVWGLCGVQFAAGLAIRKSRLWGFIVCLIASILGALGAHNVWSTIDVLLVVYCVVRLAGQLGPKPT